MEKKLELRHTHCLNCGATIKGEYCHICSQRIRDNSDRSLSRLFGEFLSNTFFIDNQFFISVWYLLRFPGRMTLEFIGGKRKKFISPVTLFLFVNLIYFFASPLSDYSISLEDQIHPVQAFSKWTKEWVAHRLNSEGLEFRDYAITYQNMSDSISKVMMIVNIPMIAILVFLMAFRRRRYYYDSLIFAFHFFSLFLGSWIMLGWVGKLLDFLPIQNDSVIFDISFSMWAYFIPLIYAILSIKKFIDIRWFWAIPAGMGVMLAVQVANILYRFIIFVLTFWFT